jgi:hypothetical protein
LSEPTFDEYLNDQLAADPVAAEAPVPDAEPAADEASAVEDAQAQPRGEDGKFISVDEWEKLNRRLEEKDSLIGKLGKEVGDLRATVEQPEPQKYDFSGIDQIEDPVQLRNVAITAAQQGDPIAYEKALRQYAMYDEFGANMLHSDVRAWQTQQQTLAELKPQLESAQQLSARQAQDQALNELVQRHPDAGEVLGSIDPEKDQIPGVIVRGLVDPSQMGEAHELLYAWASLRRGQQVTQVTQQVAETDQAAAESAKVLAAVGVSSATVGEDTDVKPDASAAPGTPEFAAFMLAPSPTSYR